MCWWLEGLHHYFVCFLLEGVASLSSLMVLKTRGFSMPDPFRADSALHSSEKSKLQFSVYVFF